MDVQDTIVVFTARSPKRIVREGGSQAWKLNPAHAKQCVWLLCTQNRHHKDGDFSDATQPHGSGFLLGKVLAVRESPEGRYGRWIVEISEFALLNCSELWQKNFKGRQPVRYASLSALGIDPSKQQFHAMPERQHPLSQPLPTQGEVLAPAMLTIAQARKALAATFGVQPDAIEITIRG